MRLRGELLLARSPPATAEAERAFSHALQIAQRQQAKSRDCGSRSSWSRLKQQQGRTAEALAILTPIYRWFTEGRDTPDLVEAKSLLEALA